MYNKKEWVSDELITKEALNNIENGIETLDKRNKIKYYDNVDELINDDNIVVGDIVRTLGYYVKGDGGGYIYEIVNDTALNTEVMNIELKNGLKAKYGLNMKFYDINVLSIGVKQESSNEVDIRNNALLIERMIELYNRSCKLYFPGGNYYISDINFTSFKNKSVMPEIFIYGDFSSQNESKFTRIHTQGKDFICDKRGIDPENPVVTVLKLTMKDMYIYSKGFNTVPSGICFGQDVNTPHKGQEVNFRFNNVRIIGFDYGVYSPVWACGGSGGEDVTFTNCHCGIYVGQAIHCFNATNFSFNECALGMDTGWGGTGAHIKGLHTSTGYLGSDRADFNEYITVLTRGNFTIEDFYYEPYNNNGYMDRCVLIKHEGYAFGIGPLYIKNTNIGYPGSGNTGLFLKSNCYLGYGPSRGVENPTKIYSWNSGHYPYGAVIFEKCQIPDYINTIKNVVSINSDLDTDTRKFSNVWWGYDFNGLEFNSPDLLMGLKPFIKGKGYMTALTGSSASIFKEVTFAHLSNTNLMYSEELFSFDFKQNILYPEFVARSATGKFTYEYDISLSINGTISSTADVTIGIFARKDFDDSTLRLIKKLRTIKPNEVYDEYEKHIKFELNPHYDLLEGENKIYLGYISNTNSTSSLLTSDDRQIIEYDFIIRQKDFLGYKK